MKRILVAVDESDTATEVIARAVDLARTSGARLRLVRAVTPPPIPAPPGTFMPQVTDASITSAEVSLRPLLEQVPEPLRDGAIVELGGAADVVGRAARAFDADLVVIGAHRYGLFARALGTNAARIVNRVDRPVLVVRPVPNAPTPTTKETADALRRDHHRLEKLFTRLQAACLEDDWSEVRTQWDAFELALRAHMESEEKHVLPAFRRAEGDEAAAIVAEHDQLRNLLGELGVRVDLHAVTEPEIEQLLARVRAHALREDRILYPWLDAQITAGGPQASAR